MVSETELIGAVGRLQQDALRRWIDLGWVRPELDGDVPRFDAADVIRVRLICELHYDLRIEEESLSVVLSLLDQLYATRRSMHTLLAAVQAQPEEIRERIMSRLEHLSPANDPLRK